MGEERAEKLVPAGRGARARSGKAPASSSMFSVTGEAGRASGGFGESWRGRRGGPGAVPPAGNRAPGPPVLARESLDV